MNNKHQNFQKYRKRSYFFQVTREYFKPLYLWVCLYFIHSKILSLCCEDWISLLKAHGCYVARQTPSPCSKWPSAQCIKWSSAEVRKININEVTGCTTNPLLCILFGALQQPYTSLCVDTWYKIPVARART